MATRDELIERVSQAIKELDAVRSGLIDMDDSEFQEPAWVQTKINARICLQCNEKIAKTQRPVRGCHESCAKKVKAEIKSGRLTEKEAVQSGQIAMDRKTGRPKKRIKIDEFLSTQADTAAAKIKAEYDKLEPKDPEPKPAPKKRQSKAN